MATQTFDRAALLAAVEPPRFRDGEQEYVGRILSAPEWWRVEERLAAAGDLDGPGVLRLVRTVVDELFPPPAWWRRVFRRERPVSALILSLPLPMQMEVVAGFVVALAKIHRASQRPVQASPAPTPSGLSSSG